MKICILHNSFYLFFFRGRLKDLFNREFRRTTLLLWLIWAGCSFVYYGVVLMTTELFETPGDDVCALDGQVSTCSAQCRDLDRKDYTHLLWTTLAEFPGIMLTIVTIEYLGRKKTMALEFVLLTIGLCFLFNCQSNRLLVTFIMFFVRGLASGVFQVCRYIFVVYKWSLHLVCNCYVKFECAQNMQKFFCIFY